MTATNEFVENTPATADAVSLNDGLATEALPSLSDFAEEPGGALAAGWYKAEIVEGYATRNGKQFVTEDAVSKNGDSRNLTLCLKVTPKNGEPRNQQERINYRASDFTPARLEYIKELRGEMKGVKGRWPDADAQRTSLAIASLGQIEKAVGFGFKRNADGSLNASPLIGQALDIRLKVDDNGYNEVTAHAKSGQFTGKSKA